MLFGLGSCAAAHAQTAAVSPAQAARIAQRAADAQREARHVASATRYYSQHDYSDFAGRYVKPAAVGRGVWLARHEGWGWGEIDTLMHIIARESSGSPGVSNGGGSGAMGLMQLMPGWYRGVWWNHTFNPADPAKNLHYAHLIYLKEGWAPWYL